MLKNISVAGIGAVAGALIMWRFLKKKYEQLNEADTASVRSMYKEKLKTLKEKINELEEAKTQKEEKEEKSSESSDEKGEDIISKYWKETPKVTGVTAPASIESSAKETEFSPIDQPYVISPTEFNNPEYDHYNVLTLYWYADGILTDEENGIISDYSSSIGTDWVNHFGEFGEDCVYVRNERRKVQYEILERIDNYFK